MRNQTLPTPHWIFTLIIGVAAVLSMTRAWFFHGYTDFNVYYDYAVKVRELWFGSTPPSFGIEPGNSSPFRYLPIWGALFLPFSFLEIGPARAIFVGIQWLLYGHVFRQVQKTYQLKTWQQVLLLIGTLRFAWDNAKIGQVSCLLLFFLWWAIPRGWDASGRARHLALAVSLKLQPIGLILIPFVKKRFAYLMRFALGFAVLFAASFIVGIEAIESWMILSFSSLEVLDPTTIGNQSLYGSLVRVFPAQAKVAFISLLAVTALYLYRLWSKLGKPTQLAWMMGIAFLPVFGALTWKNTYVLSLIPLAFLFSKGARAAVVLVFTFQLLSQGIIGEKLNALSLHYGALPWIAWMGWIIGFRQAVSTFVVVKHRP